MARDGVIGVTGATGAIGGQVAARLADRGIRQVMVARDPARAAKLEKAAIRAAPDMGDGDAMRRALEGVQTFFMVPAREAEDRVQKHRNAIDAAVDARVKRIVYVSFVNAAPDAVFTLARDHWATEGHIRSTGLPFTFLRMNLYMDFLPNMVGEDGVIRGPAGDGRVGAVLREDVAASATAVLLEEGHNEKTYNLTGPEAFTFTEAAAAFSAQTGREVRFESETVEEAYASRAVYDAPDWEVRGWVTTYTAVAAGDLELVTGDVRRLTGREPVSLAGYLSSL